MNKYKIVIQEVLSKEVEIEAIHSCDAIQKCEELYHKGDIIFDCDDVSSVSCKIIDINLE